jgi:hypothetical protein
LGIRAQYIAPLQVREPYFDFLILNSEYFTYVRDAVLPVYLRLCIIFMLLFIVCGLVVRPLGSIQPIHPTLRGFVEGCEGIPQPCWYGIAPGVTELNDAVLILQARDFQPYGTLPNNYDYIQASEESTCIARIGFIQREQSHLVTVIRLLQCPEITFGDVTAIFGNVKGVTLGSARILFVLEVNNTLVELDGDSFYPRNPEPYVGVNGVTIWETPVSLADPRYAWHGFVSLWRYCQLEPQVEICS